MMKTVLVVAQKGGVGKTMLANEIAYSLDRSGIPYDFYDLDPQGGSPHRSMKMEGSAVRIVDTPGHLSDGTSEQMDAADVIVIPTRASMTDREPFLRMLKMARAHASGKPVVVVVNEWNAYTANTMFTDWLKTLRDSGEFDLRCVPHSEAVPRAGMAGCSVARQAMRRGPERVFKLLLDTINAVRSAAGLSREKPEEVANGAEGQGKSV